MLPTLTYVKELANVCRRNFIYLPNLPGTPFPRARGQLTVTVEDVPETAQEEFNEIFNNVAASTDFSKMQVTQFWIKCLELYPVLSETLLCLPFFHFQQRIFVKQGFPGRWLSSINAEVDVLWKMICVVLCKDFHGNF